MNNKIGNRKRIMEKYF